MTAEQHAQAESEGWSIFWCNGLAHVERIDELDILASDIEAIALAQRMGLNVDSAGFVRDELQVTFS
jgi:hypothetical protein